MNEEQRQRVKNKLNDLEREHNIVIVFAVESGSRALGFHSKDSDFDIRFVYFRQNKMDYIRCPTSKSSDTIIGFSEDKELDWQGWDIVKTVMHLKESNPSILEWCYSPIIYVDKFEFKNACVDMIKRMHTHLSLMYHYYNMAKRNWSDWIEGRMSCMTNDSGEIDEKTGVICKKYFYVIRPVATLQYIMKQYEQNHNSDLRLLIDFNDLLEEIRDNISVKTYTSVLDLLEKKREMTETKKCDPIKYIDDWIIDQFGRFERLTKKESDIKESDVDFKAQSLISLHKKMENESSKIIKITGKIGSTARSNYLSAIGFGLQFLWLVENPDRNTKEIPQKISFLLTQVENISDNVRREISKVIDDKKVEYSVDETRLYSDVYARWIFPRIKWFMSDIDFEHFTKKFQNVDEMSEKFRAVEQVMKTTIDTIWLLTNTDDTAELPKDILGCGDPTGIIKEKMINNVKVVLDTLRPKYMIATNDILNEWFRTLVDIHKMTVKETQDKLLKIRDINTERRLKKSTNKVSDSEFDNIIHQTITKFDGTYDVTV